MCNLPIDHRLSVVIVSTTRCWPIKRSPRFVGYFHLPQLYNISLAYQRLLYWNSVSPRASSASPFHLDLRVLECKWCIHLLSFTFISRINDESLAVTSQHNQLLPHPRTLRWPKRPLNRTARTIQSDVVTVRPVGITPTILFTQCIYSDLNAECGTLWHYPQLIVNWYIHTLSWFSTLALCKYQSFSYLHKGSFKKYVSTRVTWFQVYVSLEAWIYRYGSFRSSWDLRVFSWLCHQSVLADQNRVDTTLSLLTISFSTM